MKNLKRNTNKNDYPYYFNDRILKTTFNFFLESHQINHTNSKRTIKPSNLENEKTFVKKILEKTANIFARLKNQIKFNHQVVFSARFNKQDEDHKKLDKIEIYILI